MTCRLAYVIVVLNAFRHQRWKPSKPFLDSASMWRSAQRLSASEMETPLVPAPILISSSCSTPFGIRDGNPPEGQPSGFWPFACSTPFGIRDGNPRINPRRRSTRTSAQRLSASEMETRETRCILPSSTPCAQRLSASEMETLLPAVQSAKVCMCSTPFGIRDGNPQSIYQPPDDRPVLNAFRHQRWKPRDTYVGKMNWERCSTPFGIRDGNPSQWLYAGNARGYVLNAFRHQRWKPCGLATPDR